MLINVVLGYIATVQAQVNASQQNGSKTGEWLKKNHFLIIIILNRLKFTIICFHAAVSPTETIPAKISPPSYPSTGTPLTSPPASSYPAVLVGRSSSDSKPKVPPPVPPRGTPKVKKGNVNGKGAKNYNLGLLVPGSHANNTLLNVDDLNMHENYRKFRPEMEVKSWIETSFKFGDADFSMDDFV